MKSEAMRTAGEIISGIVDLTLGSKKKKLVKLVAKSAVLIDSIIKSKKK